MNDHTSEKKAMAVIVAYTNLLVLRSGSGFDLMNLWDQTGGMHDAEKTKHALPIRDVIMAGDFRSSVVDNWDIENFHAVSIYGMNLLGDIFWETEFNTSGIQTSEFNTWASEEYLTMSWANNNTQTAVKNTDNYKLRLSPTSGTSWFAITYSQIPFYSDLPKILVARSPSKPFADPKYLSGHPGCWAFADLTTVTYFYSDHVGLSPSACIGWCKQALYTVAILTVGMYCNCGYMNSGIVPTNHVHACYAVCPGSATELCGGNDMAIGSAYYVPDYLSPGYVKTEKFLSTTVVNINTTLQLSGSELVNVTVGRSADVFLTNVSVAVASSVLAGSGSLNTVTYTVWYSEQTCAKASGNMKNVSFVGMEPLVFAANGSVSNVDILKVNCLELRFNQPVAEAVVELFGPTLTSDHVEVPALVIRGKHFTEATTTTSSPLTFPTTETALVSQSTTNVLPTCHCPCNIQQLNLTTAELEEKIDEIQRRLSVNVSTLSSSIRKLTCAEDSRVSAVSIGYLGVGILVTILASIVFLDASSLYRDIKMLINNVKLRLCGGSNSVSISETNQNVVLT